MPLTDLCDVHDFDGRQLPRLDMSTLERKAQERRDKETVSLSVSQCSMQSIADFHSTNLCRYCLRTNNSIIGQLRA